MKTEISEVEINGIKYVSADSKKQNGKRAVVVVDRGWIFAGDVVEDGDRIKLSRAVLVFSWNSVGFDGVIENPNSSNVKIKKMTSDVDIPRAAELFRCPVSDDWGLV